MRLQFQIKPQLQSPADYSVTSATNIDKKLINKIGIYQLKVIYEPKANHSYFCL